MRSRASANALSAMTAGARLLASLRDVTTLITGPSGTGKELVARAVGLSGYIPFDDKTAAFASDFVGSFHALNLSALPVTLIESELFGHRRGAFTGAVSDRRGWLEICEPGGAVFLDEIGDLDPVVRVKLLRVLETRTFQPVGGTTSRRFHGKIIAATNRDLAEGMRTGQFRPDFYYRLCSDVIVTPSLHDQLRERKSGGIGPSLELNWSMRTARSSSSMSTGRSPWRRFQTRGCTFMRAKKS